MCTACAVGTVLAGLVFWCCCLHRCVAGFERELLELAVRLEVHLYVRYCVANRDVRVLVLGAQFTDFTELCVETFLRVTKCQTLCRSRARVRTVSVWKSF